MQDQAGQLLQAVSVFKLDDTAQFGTRGQARPEPSLHPRLA
jgi:hypothetical protein